MLYVTMGKNEKRRMMYDEGASDVCVAMAIAEKSEYTVLRESK